MSKASLHLSTVCNSVMKTTSRNASLIAKMHFVWIIPLLSLLCKLSLANSSVNCGKRQIRTQNLILNGFSTYAGQFPWHAALYHRTSATSLEYACGGSLISDTFVLTAAHCVRDGSREMNTKRVVIFLGLHDRNDFDPAMFQQVLVLEIYTVSGDRWAKLRNDVALLELRSKVRYTDFVQPVCLAAAEVPVETVGIVAGWGKTEDGNLSQELKSSSMPIVRTIDCLMSDRDSFGQSLDSGMICAGYLNGTTVCNGDSGSGLIAELENGTWFLVGIVSFTARSRNGTNCSPSGYGVFVDVHVYLPWIRNVTEKSFSEHESLIGSFASNASSKVRIDELQSFPTTTPNSAEDIFLRKDTKISPF